LPDVQDEPAWVSFSSELAMTIASPGELIAVGTIRCQLAA